MLTHLLLVFFKVFFLTFLHLYNKGISRVVILFSLYCSIFKMLFPLPLRAALILYHIQNCLSSTFSSFFKSFFCVALSCETALILYHFLFFLSSTFFKFFSKSFFVISSTLFRGNLIIISLFLLFVKCFLKSFFCSSLSSSRNGLCLLLLFLLTLSKVKAIFSLPSPAVPRARQ